MSNRGQRPRISDSPSTPLPGGQYLRGLFSFNTDLYGLDGLNGFEPLEPLEPLELLEPLSVP